jgi:hypothetical protein
MTKLQSIAAALARIPRGGQLHDDIRAESAVLIKKLRRLFHNFRLGSVLYTLFTLTAEYASQLLKVEAAGCDCTEDCKNGLFKCTSSRDRAVVIPVIEEKIDAKRIKQ